MLEPNERLGVYRTIDDVPTHHRLEKSASVYDGRDVFAEMWAFDGIDPSSHARRGAELWTDYLADLGKHPALAHPDDMAAFAQTILDRYAESSLYNYGREPWKLYDWLVLHPDHPHTYNPLLMSASVDESTYRLYKIIYQ